MGDTAASSCLIRSISNPLFASCELKEGDPLRALTTSVSFGRFLTEPLDWERWSSFSHNRILEDVKKHSRPGAVAEKKAFFEAHYKRTASLKVASSPEKENKAPATNIDNIRENESNEDVCSPISGVILSKTDNIHADTESICQVNVSSPSTNVVFSGYSRVDDNMPTPCFSQSGQVEQEKRSTENKKTQIKDAASDRETNPKISLVKSLSRNGAYRKLESPRKASSPAVRVRQAAKDVMEKTRSALQSLQMSMNFSPARNKNVSSKTLSKPPKDNLARVSSVNGVKKNSQVVPRPENTSKTVVLKSASTKNSEASSVCTKKPRSTTVPSSFCFRSEERAAKRKAVFQKLEEKGNINETKKITIQPIPKEKVRNVSKRLRSGTVLEAKRTPSETIEPSNNMQKVLPTQCCSTIRVRKPKNFIEINKKKLSRSMAYLPTREQ